MRRKPICMPAPAYHVATPGPHHHQGWAPPLFSFAQQLDVDEVPVASGSRLSWDEGSSTADVGSEEAFGLDLQLSLAAMPAGFVLLSGRYGTKLQLLRQLESGTWK